MKLKENEKKLVLGSVLFTIFIFSRALKLSSYIGDMADNIFSVLIILVILYLVIPFSKSISKKKSLHCKSFGK